MKLQDGGYTIRLGSAAEIDTAWAIWKEAVGGSRPNFASASALSRLRMRLASPSTVLLFADCGGKSVGVTVIAHALSDGGAGPPIDGLAHIARVGVNPNHWGRGIGRALVLEALSQAVRLRYRVAQLWVHEDNERAVRLYEHIGFKRTDDERLDDAGDRMRRYEIALSQNGRADRI